MTSPAAVEPSTPAEPTSAAQYQRQGMIGIGLAGLIVAAWASLHVFAVFFFPWGRAWAIAPLVIAAQCWLYVGLFIIAHDCMHGSLKPFAPKLNRRVGQFVLLIYAGFDFDKLNAKHHAHHRNSGTSGDPDFDARPPHGFWAWYAKFFSEYFSLRECVIIAGLVWTYVLVLGAPLPNVMVFWALPALLSSVQLFLFGTYLPHKPGSDEFHDRHRTRSTEFSWVLSLLTCFHFGYHHEHHERPGEPWWRLPGVRK